MPPARAELALDIPEMQITGHKEGRNQGKKSYIVRELRLIIFFEKSGHFILHFSIDCKNREKY